MAKNPFSRSDAEVKRNKAEIEAALAPKSAGNADGASDPPAVEPSATATKSEPTVEAPTIVAPLSAIVPSDLLDRLEEAKTGESKIKAGRAYVAANPDTTSEDMVKALGSNPRDHSGGGRLRTIGYWPSGTVAKATAILEAHPAGDP